MRKIILPLAAIALLSACKSEAPATQDAGAPADTMAPAATPVALPTVPADARASVKYVGSYTQAGADGKTSTLKINADNTYELTNADATTAKGTYEWYKDGQRILLDSAGGKAIYAVADGAIYKMADKDAVVTAVTGDQMWTRAPQ